MRTREAEAIAGLFKQGLSIRQVAREITTLGSAYSLQVGHVGNAESTNEMLVGIIRDLMIEAKKDEQ